MSYDYSQTQQTGFEDDYAEIDSLITQEDWFVFARSLARSAADPALLRCDSWAVIASYFADKTLVSQQIDSFNEFVNNTMQELVDEGQSLILDQNMQHTGKAGDVTVSFTELELVQSRGSGDGELTVARAPTETLRAALWSDLPLQADHDRSGRYRLAHVPQRSPPAESHVSRCWLAPFSERVLTSRALNDGTATRRPSTLI